MRGSRIGDVLRGLGLALAIMGIMAGAPAHAADGKSHKLLLAIDGTDPAAMTTALHNAQNAKRFYDSKGESLAVEVVAYSAGIEMLRADKSPVKELLAEAQKNIPNLTLSMCGNAKALMEKREGHELTLVPGARVVPVGIVRVMELEEEGWSYVKP